MLPIWLRKLNLQFPSATAESFFDTVVYDADVPKISFTVTADRESWIVISEILNYIGTSPVRNNHKKYLMEKMGIIAIEQAGNKLLLYVDPVLYRNWYEQEFNHLSSEMLVDPSPSHLQSSAITTVIDNNAKEEQVMMLDPSDSDVTTVKKSKSKTYNKKSSKEENLDDLPNTPKKPKYEHYRLYKPTPKPSNKQLSIPNKYLHQVMSDYLLVQPEYTITTALTTLLEASHTKIRNIKKSEHRYLNTNYMVNLLNKNYGLEQIEQLVAKNGRLKIGDTNQYYDVLENSRGEVVGHVVFYHDTSTKEILIPAIEASLSCRGRRYGEMLMLHVMAFAVEHHITAIRLETGHHEKAQHLTQSLTNGMITFYCKLGFRIEKNAKAEEADKKIEAAAWYKLKLDQKIALFKNEHEKCVFDFSEEARKLVLQEAVKTIYVYKIVDTIILMMNDHLKQFNKYYDVLDLLGCKEYTDWFMEQLTASKIISPHHVEACFKMLSNQINSKNEIDGVKRVPKDMEPLLTAIPKSQITERKTSIFQI